MKSKFALFHFIAIVFFPFLGFSQITITNTAEITKIKQGTTFFAMNNPDSPKATAFVEAIKKTWKLSNVECIKYTDVEKNIAPNNSFVTIGANMTTSNSAASATETRIYLELWTTNGKYTHDPKKRKHFNQADKISIATIELFADFYAQNNPSALYKMDYDAAGHFKNWSPGILANYMQQLQILLHKGTETIAKTPIVKKEELQKLATSTLFVPDYVMTKFSKNSDDESKKFDEKEIFEGFNQSYKLISISELNDKIIATTTPFYYLLFIKTPKEKFVTVTNALSGEIIYLADTGSAAYFKSGDLKELQKAAQKR